LSFYKRKEIKDVLAYLQILCNPKDDFSIRRVINEPPRGVGYTTLKLLEDFAEQNSYSFLKAMIEIEPERFKLRRTRENMYTMALNVVHFTKTENQTNEGN
jgi:DNA helicase-2/ATP-dependent DNA helicase PcrA